MAFILGYTETILAFLSFLLLFLWRRTRNTSLTNWPVLGMVPGFLCNLSHILDFGTHILKQNGGTFVFKGPWFLNMDFIITSDPVNVHHILSKNFPNYPKGKPVQEIFDVLGEGIFNVDSDLWKAQRRTIHSTLKNKKFEQYIENVVRQKLQKGLFSVLDHVSEVGMEVDMQDILKRLTSDVYWLLGIGFDPNCLSLEFPEVPYVKAFDAMEEAVFHRDISPERFWKLQRWLQIGEEKKFTKAWGVYDEFLYESISLKRQELMSARKNHPNSQEEAFDLLTAFLSEEREDGKIMGGSKNSDKFLRDVATNLLVAGRDTVSAGLSWFCWLVATHPWVEKKILEEMKEKRETEKKSWEQRIFSVEEANKFVYLHATLCETLRLYPPVPINHKTAVGEDVLPSGHHVKPNSKVLLCFYSVGRMEEIWGKDWFEFKPERWISEQGSIIRLPSYQFTTFSAGPRTCLGKDITFLQMKMVAASLLWNFHLHVPQHHPLPTPTRSITLYIEQGLNVLVSKRSAS